MFTTDPIIEFKNVSKQFSKQKQKTFKEFLPALFLGEKTHDYIKALTDINFEIKRGETIGIIGPNGSGKSTILKLIAGVMHPNSGIVTINGKVSPLIELGAGFHPELSGRENIFLNGAILGLNQKQIQQQFDNIVQFSDLKEFIDEPIKHYSSGMYMRLGFSIAVHCSPEILIIDEILAVGDPPFQQKCLHKMNEFKKNNITIIFVSHELDIVQNFCSRCIYLNKSRIIFDGPPKSAIQKYLHTS